MEYCEYRHPGLGISMIWTPNEGRTWSWSNRFGDGCSEPSFDAAVEEAEAALEAEADYKRRGVEPIFMDDPKLGNSL
jgi:hypothetical protein